MHGRRAHHNLNTHHTKGTRGVPSPVSLDTHTRQPAKHRASPCCSCCCWWLRRCCWTKVKASVVSCMSAAWFLVATSCMVTPAAASLALRPAPAGPISIMWRQVADAPELCCPPVRTTGFCASHLLLVTSFHARTAVITCRMQGFAWEKVASPNCRQVSPFA